MLDIRHEATSVLDRRKRFDKPRRAPWATKPGASTSSRLAIFAIALLGCLGCAVSPEPNAPEVREKEPVSLPIERTASPPLFRVEGGRGATLELLGTLHLGPAEGWSYVPPVDRAIDRAQTIVFEVDLRDMSEESTSETLMQHGLLPPNAPLSKLVGAETAALLDAHDVRLTEIGLPRYMREAMQPWFIMVMILEDTIAHSPLRQDSSVEQSLLDRLDSRELLALETVDEQLGFFGSLPMPLQELMLQHTLNDWGDALPRLHELVEAWRVDDRDALLRIAYEGVDEDPALQEFYDVLLDGRNRNWVSPLVDLLEDPARAETTVLVAVGALHLVGPEGLPDLLRAEGYRVTSGGEASPRSNVERITTQETASR